MLTILEPRAHLHVYVFDRMVPLGKIGQDLVFAERNLLIHPLRMNDVFINQPVIVRLPDMVVDLFGKEVVGGVHQLAPDHFVAVLQPSFKEALVIGHRLFTRPFARNHEGQPRPDGGGARELFGLRVCGEFAAQPRVAHRDGGENVGQIFRGNVPEQIVRKFRRVRGESDDQWIGAIFAELGQQKHGVDVRIIFRFQNVFGGVRGSFQSLEQMRNYLILLFDGLTQRMAGEHLPVVRENFHYLFDAEVAAVIEFIFLLLIIVGFTVPGPPFHLLDRAFHQSVMPVFAKPRHDGLFALSDLFIDLFEIDYEVVYQLVFKCLFYSVVKLFRAKFGRAVGKGGQNSFPLLGRFFLQRRVEQTGVITHHLVARFVAAEQEAEQSVARRTSRELFRLGVLRQSSDQAHVAAAHRGQDFWQSFGDRVAEQRFYSLGRKRGDPHNQRVGPRLAELRQQIERVKIRGVLLTEGFIGIVRDALEDFQQMGRDLVFSGSGLLQRLALEYVIFVR